MTVKIEGQIKGISLTNFLQIVQLEKPTCSLLVTTKKHKGTLYIEEGEIIDADSNTEFNHLQAAFEILSWENPSIELKKNMNKTERFIKMPLMSLLMEAARYKDEKGADQDTEEEKKADNNLSYESSDESIPLSINSDHNDFNNDIPDEFLISTTQKTEKDISGQISLNDEKNDLDDYDLYSDMSKDSYEKLGFNANLSFNNDYFENTDKKRPSIEDYIEKKSSWEKNTIIFLSLVLLIITIGFGGTLFFKKLKIKKAYFTLEKNLSKMSYEEQKINILKKFIEKYPQSEYSKKAEAALDLIVDRDQRISFEILEKKLSRLHIDKNYQKTAEKYCKNFLQKFPSGLYAEKTKEKLLKIPVIIRNYKLQKIKAIPDSRFAEKIKALKKFKKENPGENINETGKIKTDLGKYYLKILEDNLKNCDSLEKYDEYFIIAESFKKIFPEHIDIYRSKAIIKNLKENYWADALLNTAKQKNNSLIDEKKFLENYIASNEDYNLTLKVKERIREIESYLKKKKNFENILSYAENKKYPLADRINRLRSYIYSDIPLEFKDKAEKKLNEINRGKVKRVSKEPKYEKIEEKNKKIKDIDVNQMINNSYKTALRIKKKMSGSKRFVPAGDMGFKDLLTGKIWLLLDSDDFSGSRCLSFKKAKKMAGEIRADGYSDWRLPTEKELLTLFKNEPFPPFEKNKWFWSSNIFEKGFNTYSAVVSNTQTQAREKMIRNIFNDCGCLKVVRP